MKFLNNSAISVQNRRSGQRFKHGCFSSGYCKVSEAAKAAVDHPVLVFLRVIYPPKSNSEMAQTSPSWWATVAVTCTGEYASVLQYPEVRFDHLCHWSRDYDHREPESFIEANFGRLQRLIEGSTIRIGYSGQNPYGRSGKRRGMGTYLLLQRARSPRWEKKTL